MGPKICTFSTYLEQVSDYNMVMGRMSQSLQINRMQVLVFQNTFFTLRTCFFTLIDSRLELHCFTFPAMFACLYHVHVSRVHF